ncbi:MAG: hypothetical protein ACP5N2_07405 [Candidatus Nanoarchaeia archaeon]
MEYFTKIKEPKKLRVSMMTAARDSVIIISMLESFSETRKEKALIVSSLREDFKEMNSLCRQLSELIADEKTRREVLDAVKINIKAHKEEIQKKEVQKIPPKVEIKVPKPAPVKKELPKIQTEEEVMPQRILPKEKTEVDRLEYTLSQIEQKLSDLQR